MQFSSRLPIATHILLAIALFGDEQKFTSNVLAGSTGVNPVIIRNTLGMLKAAGLVSVEPGVGGATLTKEPSEITLLDVFRAVEEDEDLFRFHEHPSPDCPVGSNIHVVLGSRLHDTSSAMEAQLAETTIQDLADDTNKRIEAKKEKTG